MTAKKTACMGFLRDLALAPLAGVVIAATLFAGAKADDLVVKYDQSQLIRLPRPATDIIIGNPAVADVTIQAGNLLVVTGKTYGITNIIALDNERNIIQDQRVIVRRDDNKMVSLRRGPSKESYTCTPECYPAMMLGDDPKFIESVKKSAETKVEFSEKMARGGGQGGGGQ